MPVRHHHAVCMLALLLCIGSAAAGSDKDKSDQSLQTRSTVKQHDLAAQRAKLAYREALIQAKHRAVRRLTAQLKRAMRDGDLDKANRIDAVKEKYAQELEKLIDANKSDKDRASSEPKVHQWKEAFWKNPAQIECRTQKPIRLDKAGDQQKWYEVPKVFRKRPCMIYSGQKKGGSGGVTEFTVTQPGYLLLACNWSYQGNSAGSWTRTRMTREEFIEAGWNLLDTGKLDRPLKYHEGREQVLFYRKVEKGEHYRLRCNKYDPPFVILFTG